MHVNLLPSEVFATSCSKRSSVGAFVLLHWLSSSLALIELMSLKISLVSSFQDSQQRAEAVVETDEDEVEREHR